MMLTADVLRQIMPYNERPDLWADILLQAINEAQALPIPRAAALLAQIAHESGECRWLEELSDGSAYEGRCDLGNIYPGDGQKYKGRGLIQLTGRYNYRAAGKALDVELELHPEDAAQPRIAGRVAAWFWRGRGCNPLADRFQFSAISKVINGGLHGLPNRQRYYLRALEALGKAV